MTTATIPTMDEALRYPIGKFDLSQTVTPGMRPALIETFRRAPEGVRRAVEGLDDRQLDTPYRPGGWTLRQVVHHLVDSHVMCYIRYRLALTEDSPLVKGYDEAVWAELPDARTGPVSLSLPLLALLHDRWTAMMSALTDEQWARTFQHSQLGKLRLDTVLAFYVWHVNHHTAHITRLRERMGW